jgi:hypothetical protein
MIDDGISYCSMFNVQSSKFFRWVSKATLLAERNVNYQLLIVNYQFSILIFQFDRTPPIRALEADRQPAGRWQRRCW